MKNFNRKSEITSKFVWLLFLLLLVQPVAGVELKEEKFDVLEIGTQSYTNVTVTTKAKSSIFITHASGMTSIKVADLPPDVRQKLGYEAADPDKPKASTNSPAVWAKQTIAKIQTPEVKEMEEKMKERLNSYFPDGRPSLESMNQAVVAAVAGGWLLFYLFYCYCCRLICLKAGHPPGVLVWLPVLKIFPLLRAAGMSGWWFLAFFIPLLNLVAAVMWCFNIASARGKTGWTGLCMVLPVLNLFAFLYLAFSDSLPEKEPPKKTRLMAFETA